MLTKTPRPLKDSYFDLVRQFPLVPIRSESGYDAAIAFLNTLAIRGEDSLDEGEQAYLDALTQFVEDYEESHHRIEVSDLKPLDALKYLMKENDMTPADLGRLLGNRSLASQILHGKRSLSKTHIRILASRFKVEPGLFFEE
jgi:HTH-type transcriptional regulator/antitoxin HigA